MVVVVERGERQGGGGGPVPHSPVKTVQPPAQPHRLLEREYFTNKKCKTETDSLSQSVARSTSEQEITGCDNHPEALLPTWRDIP